MHAHSNRKSRAVFSKFSKMETAPILLLMLIAASAPGDFTLAQADQRDALFIPTVNCMDEYHFCFGVKGNKTSISKKEGCLNDISCDLILIADASDVNRIRWNLQMRKPEKELQQTEKLVAFFYVSPEDVCQSCDYEAPGTAFGKLPSSPLIIEYQLLDPQKAPKSRQFMIQPEKDGKGSEKQAGGARNLIDERAGDTTFDLKDDVVAPNNYWGIIFTSTRKIKYGQREVDVLRDSLHPHLVLLRVLHDPLKPNTKPLSTDVITNVGLKKFLLFSDKDDVSDYHASVRAWAVRIILMLVLLLLIAIGCVCYYRSQMGTRRHVSPDNINDVFDQ